MVTLTIGSLANVYDVKRLAGLNSLTDISDGEIGSYILDATKEVFQDYGTPIKVSYVDIEANTGSTLYDFTGTYEPVYAIQRITIGGDFQQEVPTGSYTEYLDTGFIDIDLTYLQSKDGEDIKFEYVPVLYHQIVANIAAADLLTSFTTNTGDDTEVAKITRISERIGKLRNELAPKGAFNATLYANQDPRTQGYKFVEQNHWYDLY